MFVKNSLCFIVLLVVNSSIFGNAANILCLAPYDIYSHYKVFRGVFLELSDRGHNVTILSQYEEKDAPDNYRHVKVNGSFFGNFPTGNLEDFNTFEIFKPIPFLTLIFTFRNFHNLGLEDIMTSFKDFVDNDNTQFDLVIAEDFMNPPLFLLAHKYKVPLITYVAMGGVHWVENYMGNPMNLHYVPYELQTFPPKMKFWDRLRNVYCTSVDLMANKWYYGPSLTAFSKAYFNKLEKPLPNLIDIQKNISLVLVNGHFSMGWAQSNLPNIIEVAGLHINPIGKLPEALEKILDNAENDVIYFSMGSILKTHHMSQHNIAIFLEVFGKLNQTVLWKWEGKEMQNKPKNIILGKWFPQSDVLGHPKVRLFISHGGLLSTQEAAHRGVPIVGIPIYNGDQPSNVLMAEELGYAKYIDYYNLSFDETYRTIREVLDNPKYMERAKNISAIFNDRPMSAMDTAIYWIEYVIRHKGAYHMKTPASFMPWYEYYLLDVFAVITLGAIVVVTFICILIKCSLCLIFKRKNGKNIARDKKYK